MNAKSFLIGLAAGDHVAVDVHGYQYEKAEDKHDANWLKADIGVYAGVWSGRVRKAFLTTQEIRVFREQVEALAKSGKGEAKLEPMEPYVVIKLHGDGAGRVEVSGVAFDAAGGVNALAFNWTEDLQSLHELARQLKSIEKNYPSR